MLRSARRLHDIHATIKQWEKAYLPGILHDRNYWVDWDAKDPPQSSLALRAARVNKAAWPSMRSPPLPFRPRATAPATTRARFALHSAPECALHPTRHLMPVIVAMHLPPTLPCNICPAAHAVHSYGFGPVFTPPAGRPYSMHPFTLPPLLPRRRPARGCAAGCAQPLPPALVAWRVRARRAQATWLGRQPGPAVSPAAAPR
eukprot:gene11465-biopygen1881